MFGIFSTALRHKIWFDLWGAKQRTFQAILTIMIGSFVVGAIFGGWGGISVDTRTNFEPTQPPSVNLRVSPPADAQVIEALQRNPRLEAVEGLMVAQIRWRPTPEAAWRPASLQARADYDDQHISLLRLEQGVWPTGSRFAVERGFPINIGDQVELEIDTAAAGGARQGSAATDIRRIDARIDAGEDQQRTGVTAGRRRIDTSAGRLRQGQERLGVGSGDRAKSVQPGNGQSAGGDRRK
jgi:hypothetical protein